MHIFQLLWYFFVFFDGTPKFLLFTWRFLACSTWKILLRASFFVASRWVVAHHRCDCSSELSPPAASQQQRIDKFLIAPSNENPATAAFTPDVILSDLPVRTPAEQQQLQLMRRAHRSLKTLPRLLSFNVICAVNISSSLLTFSLPAGFKEMLLRKLSACQR